MRFTKSQQASFLLFLPLFTTTSSALTFQFPSLQDIKSKLLPTILNLPNFEFIKKLTDQVLVADQSALLSLHKSLVDIPSVTGTEKEISEWLANYLTSKNYTVETQIVQEERQNVFAYLGKNRNTHTLITSHIDTVPPFIPYKETSSVIYGRGSNDAKASVAAQIAAIEELRAEGVIEEGDVSMLFVVGEETIGDGMNKANELGVEWKAVIFGEPTELKLALGHKGIIEFEVIAKGKAAHSGYPHLGISANSQLIKALYALDNLILPYSTLLGNSTLNIGQIEGGVAANVIPPSARAVIAVRVAGDLIETIKVIENAISNIEGVQIVWFKTPNYGPVTLDHDIEGFQTTVCSYGTDVIYLKGDHKKYLYGPGSILNAHGDNEHVLKADLYQAVAGYKKLVKETLNPTKRVPAIITSPQAQEENKSAPEKLKEEVVENVAQKVVEKSKEPIEVTAQTPIRTEDEL